MAIVDYLRYTAPLTDGGKHRIEIPPFHGGALGFVPGVQVHVGLVAGRYAGHGCELVATAFPGQMATASAVHAY
jgi:hypothetical protein